jgi:hypothetical protein
VNIKSALKSAIAADPDPKAPVTQTVPATQAKGSALAEADAAFAGLPTGYENVTANDLVIPRIVVLQGLSPQLNKNKPEYIEGASNGDFCDVATGSIWKGNLELIPCYFAVVHLEWAPRDSGKGLIANHGTDVIRAHKHATKNDRGQWVTKEGNIISDTATFYCLNVSDGLQRCFVPLSSTAIKDAKLWMTAIGKQTLSDGSQAPLYYRSWFANTVSKNNAKGDWNGWKFRPGRKIIEIGGIPLRDEALAFHKEAREGLVQGTFDREDATENSDRM